MITQTFGQPFSRPIADPIENLVRAELGGLLRFVKFFLGSDAESTQIVHDALGHMTELDMTESSGLYSAACAVLRKRESTASTMRALERSGGLCLLLKEIGGLRYAEIADVLGINAGLVRVQVASVRASLLLAG